MDTMALGLSGQFLDQTSLNRLNSFLENHAQNFSFNLERGGIRVQNQLVGLVFGSRGQLQGPLTSEIKGGNLVLLARGEYQLVGDCQILAIRGARLFAQSKVIDRQQVAVTPSTLGGARKLLKEDNGQFNIDVHLIWVDDQNVKIPHYHTRLFELYLVEEGMGEIHLKDLEKGQVERVPLETGGFVLVPPKVIHKADGRDLVITVVGIPAFYHDDSFKAEL